MVGVARMITHTASLLDPGLPSPPDVAAAGAPVGEPALALAYATLSSRMSKTASKASLESWRALLFRRRLRHCMFFNPLAKRFFSSLIRCCSPLRSPMAVINEAKLPPAVPGSFSCAANACTAEWISAGGALLAAPVAAGVGLSDMVLPTPRCGSREGQRARQKNLWNAGYHSHDHGGVVIDVTMGQGRRLLLHLTCAMADVAVALRAEKYIKQRISWRVQTLRPNCKDPGQGKSIQISLRGSAGHEKKTNLGS